MIKKIILSLLLGINTLTLFSQNTLTIKLIDKESKEAIIGASVYIKNTTLGATSDLDGKAIINSVPNGTQTIVVSFIGYETYETSYVFPIKEKLITIELHEDEETLDTVVISSTRSRRSIAQIPTRVEVLGGEELGEKAIMNSANIAMLLRESTGIQMQQTSANSANQSIRIQGLDGRFTQLLKDGFPMFGGFASGLSIMQIPPLDLKQVEIIKGSSSTLYGGGAIAGIINLISKQPKEERELEVMLDKTSRYGTTLNVFYSEKKDDLGVVLYTTGNLQQATDVNDDHFSDIPKVQSFSFSPSLFYYPNEQENYRLSLDLSVENRVGGDIDVINKKTSPNHNFFEENDSNRFGAKLSYNNELSDNETINVKTSLSYFKRDLILPNYQFKGNQLVSFTEASFNTYKDGFDWVLGANLITEKFTEKPTSNIDRSYNQITYGAFAQNNWNINEKTILESGVRTDFTNNYGMFFLPKVSVFYKFNESFTSRIGGGLGYKVPTIFTEDSELRAFKNVLNIDPDNFKAETSIGFNLDFDYKTRILNDAVSLTFNQLFFFTSLKNTIVLAQNGSTYEFQNSNRKLNSYGFETNLKFKYKNLMLFTNYAFNNVKIGGKQKVLTPKHSLGGVLMYEVHGKWRIGYEAYYKSSQFRTDFTETPNYWTMGIMAMRTFDKISLYANFENFTDTKQSNYQPMVTAPHTDPTFTDIWAPTDGFVFNAGILIKL